MRILFVIPYFYEAWAYGGQPRSAFEMAKALVARGHSVEVLTTDSGGVHRLEIPEDGFTRVDGITIRYYRNVSNTLAFRYRFFLPLAFFGDIGKQIRNADVVHVHELRSLLSVSAASASRRQSIPFVKETHLVLAGPDDGQSQFLRRTVARLEIGDRVTFTGYLDQVQKFGAIVDSRLVVIPSRSEVFAITAMEALMCSRPVLLSSACDLSTVLGEENGVRTFEHDSIEDLQVQLRQILGDRALFQNAAKGRAFVVRQFPPEALANSLEKAYLSVGATNG